MPAGIMRDFSSVPERNGQDQLRLQRLMQEQTVPLPFESRFPVNDRKRQLEREGSYSASAENLSENEFPQKYRPVQMDLQRSFRQSFIVRQAQHGIQAHARVD